MATAMRKLAVLAVWLVAGLLGAAGALPRAAQSAETRVAVAANFTEAARQIAEEFERATGHRALLSFGSTGQLFTQITQDAPFEVFLAADAERPLKAVEQGLALADSRFTYAVGRLVLFSADAERVKGEETLRAGAFEKLAIANPTTAPYGAAAIAVLKQLGVHDALQPKLVQGNDLAQTYQFVETGNAELGFVALSQIARKAGGSRWIVPASLHEPIQQDAVLLKQGTANEAAQAFLAYLKGPQARAVLEQYGYTAPAE
jgi:molybdate transport system substrate-binding protein